MDSICITEEKIQLQCLLCGDQVSEDFLRDHLCKHNPNAAGMEAADVKTMFRLATCRSHLPNKPRTVVVSVRGGVAEVEKCPDDVIVEIMDYDNERR